MNSAHFVTGAALSAHLALGIALSGVAPAQSTWRVPGHYPTIEEAVVAAAPGDRILLTNTFYLPAGQGLLIDKGLVIEPEAGKRATIGYLWLHHHGVKCTALSGANLILRNLDIVPGPPHYADYRSRLPLEIRLGPTERGEVVLDSVRTHGLVSNAHRASHGLVVSAGPDVTFLLRNSHFRGASGDIPWLAQGETGWDGSHGAVLDVQGHVLGEGTDFEAGPGGDSWGQLFTLPKARDGGAGIVGNATALATCSVVDGKAGDVYVGSYGGDPQGKEGRPGVSTIPGDHFDVRHQPGREGWINTRPRPPEPQAYVLGEGRRDIAVYSQQVVGMPFTILARSVAPDAGLMLLLVGSRPARLPLPEPPGGAIYLDGIVALYPMTPAFADVWYQAVPGHAAAPLHGTVFVQAVTYRFDTQIVTAGCPASFTFFHH